MAVNLSEILLNTLCRYCRRHGIEKVILFGSRAKGTNTPRSDIDIAVYGGDFEAFSEDVKENFPSLLMFDIVNMNRHISDDLQAEIDRYGVTIYEKT